MEETNLSNPDANADTGTPNVPKSSADVVQQAGSTNPPMGAESSLTMDDIRRIDEGRGVEGGQAKATDGTRGDVETTTEPAQETGQPEATPDGFDFLTSDLPDDETFELDGFYKGIKPEHLEKLEPLSKRVIHNLRRDYHNKRQRDAARARELEVQYQVKDRTFVDRERALVAQQKAFSNLLNDKNLRSVLEKPDSELPDLMSPEGIEARIEKATAQKLVDLIQPVREATEVAEQRNALQDFITVHPEMKSGNFRKDVATLIKNRQQMGFAISTPDAYEIVRSRQETAANERDRARERQARAASARQIGRGRSSAAANSGPPKGAKAHELFEWLKAHPEEAKRIAGRR